jgi:hypothetical protein
MLTDSQREELRGPLRAMQIIAGALAAGVLFFLGFVVVQAWRDGRGPSASSLITYIAIGYSVLTVIGSVVVPGVLSRSMQQSMSPQNTCPQIGPLTQRYQTLLIIRAAIIEGAAFFCLVAYMIERQAIALIAAAILLLLLGALIPTMSRLESFVENEIASAELPTQTR